jgi:hypothetical protein
VAYEDALTYAEWRGRSLPTEAQFEYAAQSSSRRNAAGTHTANTWQGLFPMFNDRADGYADTAPVACYEPNALGLYDLIGNVWEWTASEYYPSHDFAAHADHPDGFDPAQPGEAVAVLKGGSHLCAPDYCMRYRPQATVRARASAPRTSVFVRSRSISHRRGRRSRPYPREPTVFAPAIQLSARATLIAMSPTSASRAARLAHRSKSSRPSPSSSAPRTSRAARP